MANTERLQTFGYVRQVDADSRRVTSVVSTDAVARDGAVIETAGWDLGYYEQNPVVLWAHNDTEMPIAKTVETLRTEHELIQVHEFADHPFAEQVFAGVRGGFVNATSVRWLPGETEMRVADGRAQKVLVFTRGHQLLETSYVPIPADPGALVLRADGSRLDLAAFERGAVCDEVVRCACDGCQNEATGVAVCADCLAKVNSQRAATEAVAHEARAQRVATWAEKLRAASQALKGEAE